MHNIILFGETGVGKSSIVNMLIGREAAETKNDALGCTLENRAYEFSIDNVDFRIHDTAGLNEGEHARVTSTKAIVQLFKLLRELEGGVSLLVYCMRAPRIREVAKYNWNLFYDVICRRKVVIVTVVTGLELEVVDMDDWWRRKENWNMFCQYVMHPHGHACITATRGPRRNGEYLYQEDYDRSIQKMRELILRHHMPTPWTVGKIDWVEEIYKTTYDWWKLFWPRKILVGVIKKEAERLVEECGMTETDAEKLGKDLEEIEKRITT
jgi:hypothetical protein